MEDLARSSQERSDEPEELTPRAEAKIVAKHEELADKSRNILDKLVGKQVDETSDFGGELKVGHDRLANIDSESEKNKIDLDRNDVNKSSISPEQMVEHMIDPEADSQSQVAKEIGRLSEMGELEFDRRQEVKDSPPSDDAGDYVTSDDFLAPTPLADIMAAKTQQLSADTDNDQPAIPNHQQTVDITSSNAVSTSGIGPIAIGVGGGLILLILLVTWLLN